MLQVKLNDKQEYLIDEVDGVYTIDNKNVHTDIVFQPNGLVSLLLDGKSFTGIVEKTDRKSKEVTVRIDGQTYTFKIKEPIDMLLSNMGLDMAAMQKAEPVKAPMPGMILKILVHVGQQVNKGDGIVILEAMKMENLLKAAAPGVVKAIKVTEKTAVEKGTILIEME